MRILVTGATGLVGRRTLAALAGHDVVATSRREQSWPDGVTGRVWDARSPPDLEGIDAVIHLAGASIGGKRWSEAYKRTMVGSRVESTAAIVDAINAMPERPALVCASAIGYYGRDPKGVCQERRGPGDDFLARLCVDWESAAEGSKGRVARMRFGHVLAAEDGILGRLLPIYKARLGGPIASGRQGLPWVHVDDVAAALAWAATNPDARGAYNLAAPRHVSQRQFNDALAAQLGVFAKIPLPGFALRVAVGELGPYLVGGQETPPKRLLEEGFAFQHPDLAGALADLLPR